MIYVRAPSKKRAEQARPPLTETRSAAFPACSDGFDDVDGGPERGVYIQMRGVEQVRFRRRFQGGHRPLGVALVPALDVGQDLGLIDAIARLPQLDGAAARAHLRRCGDEDFHVRIGKDDGSDVAAVEHGAGRRASEIALKRQHRLAHLGDGRDQRSRLAHRLALERRLVETAGIERLGGGHGTRAIFRGAAGIEQSLRHRAVDQAGVEMAQAIVGGEPLAERPLARGRRPVDGDDHERSAPRPRIKAEKPGKLVAMMAASSTRTGCSLANPMTRNAMAMRWSMWVVTVPPPGARPLPCTIRSSPSISTSTPFALSPAATALSRSDSFTRNSLSPRMTVVPWAKLAATANTGYSSIMDGARAAGTSRPRSADARTRKSAISSPPSLRSSSASISAPISRSVTINPVRSGLVITSARITSEPGTSNAATRGKAAEDGSAGTTTGAGASSASPCSVILRPCAPSASTVTSAPKCLSRRSV